MAHEVACMCIVLLGCIALSASMKSCGSSKCSQEYDRGCQPDMSAHLYDNSMLNKKDCNIPIGPAPSLSNSVDCYDTCVISWPWPYNSVPLQTCADLDPVTNVKMTVKKDADSNVIIEIHPPTAGGKSYQPNKFCKYNIRCPNETYMLHYTVVRVNIEPRHAKLNKCLDFLRLNLNPTNVNIPSDLCGTYVKSTPEGCGDKCGFHGSELTVDFRSNRIYSVGDFNLGAVCIPPSATSEKNPGYDFSNAYGAQGYSSSRSLKSGRIWRSDRPMTAKDFFDKVFPGSFRSRRIIIVTRGSVVKYRNRVLVVEHKGRTIHRFRRIGKLQAHNRIEGYLKFYGSASPSGRVFPGYGFLRVGRRRVAQYVQTIVNPAYLLTDEEEETVRKLFKEQYNRRKFRNYYSFYRRSRICGVNRLAERNVASSSKVVRAVANFFLKTAPRRSFCYPTTYKPRILGFTR